MKRIFSRLTASAQRRFAATTLWVTCPHPPGATGTVLPALPVNRQQPARRCLSDQAAGSTGTPALRFLALWLTAPELGGGSDSPHRADLAGVGAAGSRPVPQRQHADSLLHLLPKATWPNEEDQLARLRLCPELSAGIRSADARLPNFFDWV